MGWEQTGQRCSGGGRVSARHSTENRAFTLRFNLDPAPAERTVRRIEEIE
jgi:hypothetical protein